MTARRKLCWTLAVLLGLTVIRLPLAALLQRLLPDVSVAPEMNYIAAMAQSVVLFGLPGWLLMCSTKAEGIGGRGLHEWLVLAIPAAVLARLALPALNALWSGLLALDTPSLPVPQGMMERVLQALALAVVPAIAEEIFFRGAVLRNLQGAYGRHTALWLTTLFFALMHGSLGGLPGHLVISLLLTLLAMHSGGALTPIVVHMAYNLLQFQTPKGALGAMLLLAGLLALLLRRVPAGGMRPQGRDLLLCGAILAAMAVQYLM